MEEQLIKRLQLLNRQDELRSRLLIEGLKRILQRNKNLSWFKRYAKHKKITIPAGWN